MLFLLHKNGDIELGGADGEHARVWELIHHGRILLIVIQ